MSFLLFALGNFSINRQHGNTNFLRAYNIVYVKLSPSLIQLNIFHPLSDRPSIVSSLYTATNSYSGKLGEMSMYYYLGWFITLFIFSHSYFVYVTHRLHTKYQNCSLWAVLVAQTVYFNWTYLIVGAARPTCINVDFLWYGSLWGWVRLKFVSFHMYIQSSQKVTWKLVQKCS